MTEVFVESGRVVIWESSLDGASDFGELFPDLDDDMLASLEDRALGLPDLECLGCMLSYLMNLWNDGTLSRLWRRDCPPQPGRLGHGPHFGNTRLLSCDE
jgi:hypothetical protein